MEIVHINSKNGQGELVLGDDGKPVSNDEVAVAITRRPSTPPTFEIRDMRQTPSTR